MDLMIMTYRIVRQRPGVIYPYEYRKTLEGAKSRAERHVGRGSRFTTPDSSYVESRNNDGSWFRIATYLRCTKE